MDVDDIVVKVQKETQICAVSILNQETKITFGEPIRVEADEKYEIIINA